MMGLLVSWYALICFALVAFAIFGSLWTIRKMQCQRHQADQKRYESLLIVGARDVDETGMGALSWTGHVGSANLWLSCWRGVHPGWLLGLRLVSFVSLVGVLSWDFWIYQSIELFYYTEWTFVLVIIYFAIATLISAHGCWSYSKLLPQNEEANEFLKSDLEKSSHATLTSRANGNSDSIRLQKREVNEKRAGFWGYLMQIIYQTCAGAAMLTDVVFWCLLVPFMSTDHFSVNVIMFCMHSLNAIFLILDTALNNLTFPWFRMAYFVLWSCIYVIFQWVLHACGLAWWPYPFLELATPWAPVWYICMALVHIPCYGLYWLIVKAKNSYFPKFFPHAYVRS